MTKQQLSDSLTALRRAVIEKAVEWEHKAQEAQDEIDLLPAAEKSAARAFVLHYGSHAKELYEILASTKN